MAENIDTNGLTEEEVLKLYEDIIETPDKIYLSKGSYCYPIYGTGGSSNTTVGYRCT